MNESTKESREADAKVAAAGAKVALQSALLAKLSPDDPARAGAERLLSLMKSSASSTTLNQSLQIFSQETKR